MEFECILIYRCSKFVKRKTKKLMFFKEKLYINVYK